MLKDMWAVNVWFMGFQKGIRTPGNCTCYSPSQNSLRFFTSEHPSEAGLKRSRVIYISRRHFTTAQCPACSMVISGSFFLESRAKSRKI